MAASLYEAFVPRKSARGETSASGRLAAQPRLGPRPADQRQQLGHFRPGFLAVSARRSGWNSARRCAPRFANEAVVGYEATPSTSSSVRPACRNLDTLDQAKADATCEVLTASPRRRPPPAGAHGEFIRTRSPSGRRSSQAAGSGSNNGPTPFDPATSRSRRRYRAMALTSRIRPRRWATPWRKYAHRPARHGACRDRVAQRSKLVSYPETSQ